MRCSAASGWSASVSLEEPKFGYCDTWGADPDSNRWRARHRRCDGWVGRAQRLCGLRQLLQNHRAAGVVRAIEGDGGQAVTVQADISVESEVVRLSETVDRARRLSALINNAATLESQMRLDAMDAARMCRAFATNVVGMMLCAREAVRRMSTHCGGLGGGIANVSSGAARDDSAGEYVAYAATKGAVETFTIGLAKEVAEEGIRASGFCSHSRAASAAKLSLRISSIGMAISKARIPRRSRGHAKFLDAPDCTRATEHSGDIAHNVLSYMDNERRAPLAL